MTPEMVARADSYMWAIEDDVAAVCAALDEFRFPPAALGTDASLRAAIGELANHVTALVVICTAPAETC